MAGEWRKSTVGELAAPVRNALVGGPFGSNLVSCDYVDAGVPVIRGQNMGGRWVSGEFVFVTDTKASSLDANLARPGDIVFTQRGTLGQVSVVPEGQFDRYLVSQSQMKLTVDRDLADPMFIYYLFSTSEQKDYIRQNSIQTGVPHTNLGILRRTPVSFPPLPVQRAIAHILGTLDDKIELNRRMNETLEAMARALFKSWFVDFDPVRAKHALSKVEGAGGRPSTSSGRAIPGLPKPLADLFPDAFEDSELGEIPKGWKLGTLADFALVNPESWSKETRPDVINYVDLSNTKWGSIEAITLYKLRDAPSRAQRVLRPGDTIVGTVRPGNGSYALISADGLTGSTGFAVLRPRRPEYAQFVYLVATAAESIEAFSHLADGGAYPAVRPEVVIATQAIRPGDKVLAQFSMLSDPLLAAMAQNECESRSLAALRDTLLPKIISGELRIKGTEQSADLPN